MIVIVTALMVLAEMGFNITTIVAGTSVAAVAIAFGVQSIVKDLVSGVFLLVEDQFGVGDFVDMEKASGIVEAIGLRVTQLRDDDGTVWYVRNGEVLRIGNFSQGGPGRPPEAEAPPGGHSASDAFTVMVVPVRARETGQFFSAAAIAAENALGVDPRYDRPHGQLDAGDALAGLKGHVGLGVDRGRRRVAGRDQLVGHRHREAGGVGRGDQLLGAGLAVRLLGTCRPADLEAADAGGDELDLALTLLQ